MEQQEKLPFDVLGLTKLYGPIVHCVGPSGKNFVLREQTGEDDDLLSAGFLGGNHDKVNLFITNIVVWTDVFKEDGGKLTTSNIGDLLVNDKYFILFQSRIFSIGAEMKFTYDWGGNGGVVDYVDNLNNYIWDFGSKEPIPEEGEEGYFQYRMRPYSTDINPYEPLMFTTSSGKEVKMFITNVRAEKELLAKGQDVTRNDDLKARGLELHTDTGWMKVNSFKFFSKKDMIQMHEYISQFEIPFFAFTEIENPVTNKVELYPLVIDPAFFFPLGI